MFRKKKSAERPPQDIAHTQPMLLSDHHGNWFGISGLTLTHSPANKLSALESNEGAMAMGSIILRVAVAAVVFVAWTMYLGTGFGDYVLYPLGVRNSVIAQLAIVLVVPLFAAIALFHRELLSLLGNRRFLGEKVGKPALVILGFAVMIVAAPASQMFLMSAVVNNTQAGFNSPGGLLALGAVFFGWIPGAMLGGLIAAAGASSSSDRGALFQLVTSLGFFPVLISCATVNNPF